MTSLIQEFGLCPARLLDPFAGVGTALLAGRDLHWQTLGVELLPIGPFVLSAWLAAEQVNLATLQLWTRKLASVCWSKYARKQFSFPHLRITRNAFPADTEQELAGFRAWLHKQQARGVIPQAVLQVIHLAALSVLEEVSYTRKDGQYLRWDWRSGRSRASRRFDKGPIPSFTEALTRKLHLILSDLQTWKYLRTSKSSPSAPEPKMITGSCLEVLPRLPSQSAELIFTSPPYCNRYDYTRTYGLELAWLGCTERDVKSLRQALLACTVESHEKDAKLRDFYNALQRLQDYDRIVNVFRRQTALQEVLELLEADRVAGRLNNNNIPRMVRNYFYETAFWVAECARIIRPGGYVLVVNDNVRYSGEEIPVDLICSDLAEQLGLKVEAIWTLPRGKGNSSQQMGRHGRVELRKCIYVWRKPAFPV